MDQINDFDPVLFSHAENEWLLDNLDKPTIVALRDRREGVNPAAVVPFLNRVRELDALERHEGVKWVGVEKVREAIRVYLKEDAKWERDTKIKRNAPRFPSLYSYDSKGRAHIGGPGSDAGRVRTYFGPDGKRIPFSISLLPEVGEEWAAPGFTEAPTEPLLKVDKDTSRIECLVPTPDGICGHTESFKPSSRASYNAARGRMSKHLRKATVEVEAHRELHTNEFGG